MCVKVVFVAPITRPTSVHVEPLSVEVSTMYCVMAFPLLLGAVQFRVTCSLPGVAIKVSGAFGVVYGVATILA